MGGGGFEPPKQFAADLQSVPFGHSGIHPYLIMTFNNHNKPMNGLEPLTCWLQISCSANWATSALYWVTPTGFEPMLPPWKGGVLTTWPWSLILMTASRSMQYLKYYETPRAGLEPATARLTAVCSTNWAIEDYYKVYSYYIIYLQNNIQESFYISYTSAFFG